MSANPLITIVVGGDCTAEASLCLCLESIARQTVDLEVQVIIAATGITQLFKHQTDGWEVLNNHEVKEKLVPQLWGTAIEKARAPVVAITSANCIPSNNWVREIVNSFHADSTLHAIGGAIQPPRDFDPASWAVYFARYSAFLPTRADVKVDDLAGDNAAYRLDTLSRFWKNREEGFWEVVFHRNLRMNNIQLYLSSKIPVQMGSIVKPKAFIRSRFQHGRHYGLTRSGQSCLSLVLRIMTAPLLIPFLTVRCVARIWQRRIDLFPMFCFSYFWFLLFQSAWSAGETMGYLDQLQEC